MCPNAHKQHRLHQPSAAAATRARSIDFFFFLLEKGDQVSAMHTFNFYETGGLEKQKKKISLCDTLMKPEKVYLKIKQRKKTLDGVMKINMMVFENKR